MGKELEGREVKREITERVEEKWEKTYLYVYI